ncbi:MAG: HD-GYP domain-containing protein [Deltaproteobacteria bacterium]|jgi:putative nucleotidyltransferase with HDIG domain|nr:HD-GYP domain-containing protein [Deltaproteobacteria bacterium]
MRKDVQKKVNISPSEESSLKEDTTSQALSLQYDREMQNVKPGSNAPIMRRFEEINKELLLILSMVLIACVMNYMVAAQQMLLGFYTIPTLFSAYYYGKRHATLTAFASIFFVGLLAHYNSDLFSSKETTFRFVDGYWYDFTIWAGILLITAYAMGTLYEQNKRRMDELSRTYQGLMMILRQFISKDQYTENHCYRVSIYAAKIAAYLGFSLERIEDVRSAALLHDIGKLDINRELLYKAARLSQEEYKKIKCHVQKGVEMLHPLGDPLGRIIPIILAHHDKYDGSGYHKSQGENIPLESRILAVADVYDSLISDRPYRKAMSSFEAKAIIAKGSGTDFDPIVVEAFIKAFSKGEMEVPNIII